MDRRLPGGLLGTVREVALLAVFLLFAWEPQSGSARTIRPIRGRTGRSARTTPPASHGILERLAGPGSRGWLDSWKLREQPRLVRLLKRDRGLCPRLSRGRRGVVPAQPLDGLSLVAMGLLRCPGARTILWRTFVKSSANAPAALEGLAALEGPRVLPLLERALLSDDTDVSRAAQRALVRMGDPALPYLLRALELRGPQISLLMRLVEMGTPAAIRALKTYLKKNPGRWLGTEAGVTLLFLPPGPERRKLLSWHLIAARKEGNLLRVLASLRHVPTCDALDGLLVILGLEQDEKRHVAEILGRMSCTPEEAMAAASVLSKEAGSREWAYHTIQALGGPVATSVFGKWLDPKNHKRFIRGVRALAVSGWSGAVRILRPHVRWTGRLGEETMVALGILLRSRGRRLEGPDARQQARYTTRLLAAIAKRRKDPRSRFALRALGVIGASEAVGPGLRLLASRKRHDRLLGCLVLRNLGHREKVAQALARAARSEEPLLATCAAWGLRHRAREYASLLEHLALTSPYPHVSQTSAAALAVGSAPRAILRRLRSSPDQVVARNALVGLAWRGAVDVADVLQLAMARNESTGGRMLELAVRALGKKAAPALREWIWDYDRNGRHVPPQVLVAFARSLAPDGRRPHWSGGDVLSLRLVGEDRAFRLVRLIRPDGLVRWIYSDDGGWVLETGVQTGRWDVSPRP